VAAARERTQKNKVPWIVGACLIVLFALIAFVAAGGKKSKSKSSTPPPSARAVVVPTSRERSVVVAPCGAPASSTVKNAAAGTGTPGATIIGLPKGPGVRTLLVPNCLPKTGATNAAGNLPSAAVVLPGSERPTEGQQAEITAGALSARSKAILPDGSKARTVVVTPCAKKPSSKGRDQVLSEAQGNPDVAVTPSC
jgi:hypothetical protein